MDDAYDRFAVRGFEYGPVFQGLQAVWRRGQEVFAEVAVARSDRADQAGGSSGAVGFRVARSCWPPIPPRRVWGCVAVQLAAGAVARVGGDPGPGADHPTAPTVCRWMLPTSGAGGVSVGALRTARSAPLHCTPRWARVSRAGRGLLELTWYRSPTDGRQHGAADAVTVWGWWPAAAMTGVPRRGACRLPHVLRWCSTGWPAITPRGCWSSPTALWRRW